ncbi:MAG: phosphocarrier protein HPr [Candidatus Muproteobacteria bacterium RBG_16_60_9]|uniref:Phosphocarrier protein HPr n=1 Tax=Candidatus Muproteobacteria bacterium RBG_16_60_9 TaxID=1817755 RepID=A0A1F6UVE0_9PROT|nr:MAG: phosphocarrier protein HPr [Candidatus Muproteobacteria bacterium RBG_16_60_9]
MKCADVTIVNNLGLHARAAAKLVSLASGFKSDVTLARDNQQVNAKSIMGVMMLAAAKGTVLKICAQGADEDKTIDALTQLVGERFGENQ